MVDKPKTDSKSKCIIKRNKKTYQFIALGIKSESCAVIFRCANKLYIWCLMQCYFLYILVNSVHFFKTPVEISLSVHMVCGLGAILNGGCAEKWQKE